MHILEQPLTSQYPGVGTNELGVFTTIISQLFKQSTQPQPPPPHPKETPNRELQSLIGATREKNIAPRFKELENEWKSTRRSTSFARDLISHPAYLEIIGMGPDALPLILKELETELDHWFVALKSISGEDPVPAETKGNMNEMRNAWLKWGHDKGYTW
jgi:hypothetical protein